MQHDRGNLDQDHAESRQRDKDGQDAHEGREHNSGGASNFQDGQKLDEPIWAAASGVLNLFMQGASAAEIEPSSELLFDALMAKLVRPK
jgi:hypothetical protein